MAVRTPAINPGIPKPAPPVLKIIEMKFLKDGVSWSKMVQTYSSFSPFHPLVSADGRPNWPAWGSILAEDGELYWYHPEYLMEVSIIEEK